VVWLVWFRRDRGNHDKARAASRTP